MLRRTEKIVLKDETETEDRSTPRSASERRGLGALRSAPPTTAILEDEGPASKPVVEEMNTERWRNEVEPLPQLSPEQRRDIDRWRTEVLRSVSASEDDDVQPSRWRHLLKPTNIALLAVALVAGGAAALLAMQQPGAPAPQAPAIVAAVEPQTITQVIEEPKVQVLVARTPIVVGQRLTPATIEWVEWPEDTARSDFVTQASAPDALDTMSGAVARYEFFPGEPIREVKLARADRGFLSAVLDPGTRAVSVDVSAQSASGGFILPNDRVDVVLTASVGSRQVSSTILENVRVLAINSQIGETAGTRSQADKPKDSGASDRAGSEDEDAGPARFSAAIATLALNPRQAEVIISATQNGRLSIVLRPTADVADSSGGDDTVSAANQAIRISSPFWVN